MVDDNVFLRKHRPENSHIAADVDIALSEEIAMDNGILINLDDLGGANATLHFEPPHHRHILFRDDGAAEGLGIKGSVVSDVTHVAHYLGRNDGYDVIVLLYSRTLQGILRAEVYLRGVQTLKSTIPADD